MRRSLILVAVAFMFLCVPVMAQSETVTFAWDPHPEAAQLTGFHLFMTKNQGSYGSTPTATFLGGSLVTGSIAKPGVGKYCFVLTAYIDDVGTITESAYSNEVCAVLKPKPPKLNSAVQAIVTAMVMPFKGVRAIFSGNGTKAGLRLK